MGYAISYDEVKRYKRSVLIYEDHKLDYIKNWFTQFVADNLDHNTNSLDGKDTFHGMGIIACSVLNKDVPDKRVKRIPTILEGETIERKDSIKLHWYQEKDVRSLSKRVLTLIKDIKEKIAIFKTVVNVGLFKFTNKYHYNVITD